MESIAPTVFKESYYKKCRPLIITGLAKAWPATKKWTWEYFIEKVGEENVGVYNNIKSDSYTPVNSADGYMKFGDYLKKRLPGLLIFGFFFSIFSSMRPIWLRISPGRTSS